MKLKSTSRLVSALLRFFSLLPLIILAACSIQTAPAALPSATFPSISTTAVAPTTQTVSPTNTITAAPANLVCRKLTGNITIQSVPSKLIKPSIGVKIYTPPCYDPGASIRYPVLYMLHGQTYDDAQWQQLGLTDAADRMITAREIPPLIIVMPNEMNSIIDADNAYFGSAVVDEIIPWVDQNYDTCTQRSCRAIGGLSRGGNWAVRIGLSHPELFTAIGAHSAPLFYGDLGRVAGWAAAAGGADNLPMIYIDFGKSDEDKAEMLQFDQELSQLGVVHQMVEFPGFHDNTYWSAHVEDYLIWYSSSFHQ